HRRGIFTLTQLSRDFRPRRGKGRRVRPRRYPALQAMAVRDKRVLILGARQVPDGPVRIYLDLEGDPDRDFVYLLGVIVEGNGLKEVGQFLGYSWSSPDASGVQSLVWRRSWDESGDPRLKETLLAYNRDDCAALKRVTEFVRETLSRERTAASMPGGHEMANVEDLSAAARKADWNRRSPFF